MEKSDHSVTLIDLCGHEKYLKTTLFGLTGLMPDYCMLVVGSNMGVQLMTREHISIACALNIPMFVAVTKVSELWLHSGRRGPYSQLLLIVFPQTVYPLGALLLHWFPFCTRSCPTPCYTLHPIVMNDRISPPFNCFWQVDICPENILKTTRTALAKLLRAHGKMPYPVKDLAAVQVAADSIASQRITPVFTLSSVSGQGIWCELGYG